MTTPDPIRTHPTPPAPADAMRGRLSDLLDGEADDPSAACRHWRDDEEARRDWHAWSLIGDVLRSDELVSTPRRDAAFVAALRRRLAAEPVPLAPSRPAQRTPQRRWKVPAAVAAGFVVVAGVLAVARLGAPGSAPAGSVLAGASSPGWTLAGGSQAPLSGMVRTAPPVVVRDARLDEYLRAHQAARGGIAVAAPFGGVRSVDIVVPAVSRGADPAR